MDHLRITHEQLTTVLSEVNYEEATELLIILQDHIQHRLKHYTKCITKSTPNYLKYLVETYNRKLSHKLRVKLDFDD